MATKAEIIEQLAAARIDHDPSATKTVLKALLPQQPDAPKESKVSGRTETTILDPRGRPHRTYSLALHGENFQQLAEEYVSHKSGWTLQ